MGVDMNLATLAVSPVRAGQSIHPSNLTHCDDDDDIDDET